MATNMMKALRLPNIIRCFGARVAKAQQGQALLLTIIILTFGSLVISGFLVYASTISRGNGQDMDQLLARYAAEAGITNVITDLLQGNDALSPSYTVPSLTINNYPVTIHINTPTPGSEPPTIYQYLDPGVNYGLQSLPSQTSYYFRIDNVKAGSNIRVNWAFTPSSQRWKLKLYQGLGPPGAPPPTIIAADNLESSGWNGGSGWLYNWSHTGDASIVSVESPYQGSYHLRLRRGTGYVDRAVNLTGRSNVRLQFWAKADSFEAGETATCSVSPNGTTWTVVRVWPDGEDDNAYRFEDIDLSSFSMTGEFWISFVANMSNTGDYFWVDDLKIISQLISPLVAQNSDTKGPGALFISADLITGGVYTLEFRNNSATSLVSSPSSTDGNADCTWIYAQAYKDYLISSTADTSTITNYARQAPGPTEPITGQKIYIEAWKEP